MKSVVFETKISRKDLYQFLMHHFYTGFSGIFGVILSLGALVLFILGYGKRDPYQLTLLFVMAMLFTVVQPIQMLIKASRQIRKNPVFENPLRYEVETDGISVSQNMDNVKVSWGEIRKIVETKHAFYLYLTVMNANVIPKCQMVGAVDKFKEMIRTNMEKKQYKLQ